MSTKAKVGIDHIYRNSVNRLFSIVTKSKSDGLSLGRKRAGKIGLVLQFCRVLKIQSAAGAD
ncbi:MAG: hypothetical protein A3B91_00825 [Candidatus Yanofskybacteria bacterium RIFCSPHIGHO2_02_FULL_41_29]|uniref:Uncharacterized protein n=1 Tax=Candidatus Yanofskybacteria bacterium RIFCSPHIGHO2_01_FULL_41_53 TaxID=1802663 RepID=A0A1F8EJS6_9BACT|nr:MAG: hypothetical protein A2650_00395 [Candidatus Yanofskybacteria bacterium RIFCSPHIGHO2_01_FULL_41_53]OGN12286.1 MAG: hypothetical protein A3B91_00825 [Candidatus Yanofskybacteria bacterium RIFCSPHIGHO2_02_FULL_41_29]OGN17023.1 MAG: hypothetical protein A3F48_03695 [Candidatus Yanofskybacteria bacterium RIFCSPHIGHO2_12_FULL_41_9]OGN23615.1 MAG: hypothetical protein A2916_01490 [Candidatus Yanofskybacteria bacterium RIFCSPLOWO2_01_FULL_41_67]OGN29398.1 MAG: hypothetical protein A3H54_04035 